MGFPPRSLDGMLWIHGYIMIQIHDDISFNIMSFHVAAIVTVDSQIFFESSALSAFSTKKHSKAWVCLITQLGEPWDENNCSTMGSSDKNIHPPKAYLFGVRILKEKIQPDSSCLTPGRSWLARSVLRFFFLVEHCTDLYSTPRILIFSTRPSK